MIEGCLKAAAEVHRVPAGILVLLLSVEAGRLREVSAPNANGTVDIGPMHFGRSLKAALNHRFVGPRGRNPHCGEKRRA